MSKSTDDAVYLTNRQLADALRETAQLLETHGANPFRVAAYRNAAATVEATPRPIWQYVESCSDGSGEDELVRLPTIGRSIAGALVHLVRTGRLPLLERLRGDDSPEPLFATVADIGPVLAKRIHERLGIETMWELEAAANDGRLAKVAGMGEKRLRAVRESLAGRFHRPNRSTPNTYADDPLTSADVEELLDIDLEYREAAMHGQLPRVAPNQFNPLKAAWLPILHTERNSRHFTAMYSNSARAHQTGATRDWVVIYRDDDHDHGQWTVITAHFGRLRGKRIVAGHDAESATYYAEQEARSQSHAAAKKAANMNLAVWPSQPTRRTLSGANQ